MTMLLKQRVMMRPDVIVMRLDKSIVGRFEERALSHCVV